MFLEKNSINFTWLPIDESISLKENSRKYFWIRYQIQNLTEKCSLITDKCMQLEPIQNWNGAKLFQLYYFVIPQASAYWMTPRVYPIFYVWNFVRLHNFYHRILEYSIYFNCIPLFIHFFFLLYFVTVIFALIVWFPLFCAVLWINCIFNDFSLTLSYNLFLLFCRK